VNIHVENVTIVNRLGLHARPASRIARIASRFTSEIFIVKEGEEANAKSILEVLTLASPKGTELVLRAKGSDAERAVKALKELVDSGFGDMNG
jgi:phosphocarrier protein